MQHTAHVSCTFFTRTHSYKYTSFQRLLLLYLDFPYFHRHIFTLFCFFNESQ